MYTKSEAGDIVQWLRLYIALAEDLNLVLSITLGGLQFPITSALERPVPPKDTNT